MRFLTLRSVLTAVLIVLFVGAITVSTNAQSPAPVLQPDLAAAVKQKPKPKVDPCPSRWDHRRLLRKVVRFSNSNGDYRAHPIIKGKKKLIEMRKCARKKGHKAALKQMRHDWKNRMKRWRFHRYIDKITPYGKYAIPSYIVFRESRGDRCAGNPASTAGGYYQFLNTTWTAYGGTNYPRYRPAQCAPAWEQHVVAARAWAGGAGSSHWALTR